MIVGLGTQVVECLKVRRMIERYGEAFLTRVYTPREIAFCRDRVHTTEYYAAVWAAKEATFRSLGTTWRKGLAWTDVEIVYGGATGPVVVVTGPTRGMLEARGARTVLVALAHTRTFATATAIALGG